MRDNYNNLCVLNLGKHCYSIMKSNGKVMYFENVNGKYVMPITNFNLYDNQGKSLTLVNQHFFMNQLINRINIALKKGYFSNDVDIVNYLNDLKKNSESDSNLMSLFKGSLMGEINEINFESNKREILKYLDKFRFDTFVNYNNVSIFNGSLEKNYIEDNTPQVEVLNSNIETVGPALNSNEEVNVEELSVDESNASEVVEVSEANDTEIVDVGESNSIDISEDADNTPALDNNTFDFMSVNSNDSNEFVNSNDYFDSLGNSNSQVQNNSEVVSGISSSDYFSQAVGNDIQVQSNTDTSNQNSFDILNNEVVPNQDIQIIDNVVSNGIQNISEPIVEQNTGFPNDIVNSELNVQNNNSVSISESVQPEPVVEQVSNVESVPEVTNQGFGFAGAPQLLENPAFANDVNNDPFSLENTLDKQQNSNISYIDEVKDRLSAGNTDSSDLNQTQFSNEMGSESLGFSPSNVTVGDSVISDNNELPELEKISSAPLEEKKVDKTDKKSHLGIIIFMILLVIALGALSFYLYNYVF